MSELSSWKDLMILSEKDDKISQFAHLHTDDCLDADDTVYFGELEMPITQVSVVKAASTLSRLHDKFFFPIPSDTGMITLVPEDEIADLYIKRPAIDHYVTFRQCNALHLIPQKFEDEVTIMEILHQHPHPNIVKYHGCKLRRGRITGIMLEKHRYDLPTFLKKHGGAAAFDKELFMKSLQSAIYHFHSLGFAHNDLNPGNVLVSEEYTPILIDFGSSRRIGENLSTSRGTLGWYDGKIEDYNLSEKKNDVFALEKIRAWLNKPTFDAPGTMVK